MSSLNSRVLKALVAGPSMVSGKEEPRGSVAVAASLLHKSVCSQLTRGSEESPD